MIYLWRYLKFGVLSHLHQTFPSWHDFQNADIIMLLSIWFHVKSWIERLAKFGHGYHMPVTTDYIVYVAQSFSNFIRIDFKQNYHAAFEGFWSSQSGTLIVEHSWKGITWYEIHISFSETTRSLCDKQENESEFSKKVWSFCLFPAKWLCSPTSHSHQCLTMVVVASPVIVCLLGKHADIACKILYISWIQ